MTDRYPPPPSYSDSNENPVRAPELSPEGLELDGSGAEDPLLSTQSLKQIGFSDDDGQPVYPIRRRRSGRSVIISLGYCVTVAIIGVLFVPLALLYRQGIFDDGIKEALLRPKPDHKAFPTDVGYAGPTPTGVEAGLIVTAPHLPLQTAQPPLVAPLKVSGSPKKGKGKQKGSSSSDFNVLQHWGHMSPWYSVKSHGLKEAESVQPEGCQVVGLHWLQRHGARYPTLDPEGPHGLAQRLETGNYEASGDLKFLNDYKYKLGGELLTPFGRQQLFNLGVSARVKYGYLLDRFPEDRLPLFRTESQDRMLRSAQNFAAGFFGYPAEEQYNLEVTIEWPGFNNTLAPYMTCPNDGQDIKRLAKAKTNEWDAIFLADALERLAPQINGYNLTIQDVKDFMETCAYETVALGYSAFCDLFNEEEWKGFQYRWDVFWWYSSSFGSPIARAEGLGWMQELVARLTQNPLELFNSTTNSTLHDPEHFPLGNPIYVDFTHDTVFANRKCQPSAKDAQEDMLTVPPVVLPTLNLTSFASSGPLPTDHIPKHRSFISSKFCPFATNMQIQVLSCSSQASGAATHVRIILNDGVVPLNGIGSCPDDEDGKCPLDVFTDGLKALIAATDFERECITPGLDYDAVTTNGAPVFAK